MEVTLPTPSERLSLAKATAYKPTIFITGRQHANEVSSTSHILRLAELLGSDPQYTEILKKVNVILHPVENPDGAEMAYELQKLTRVRWKARDATANECGDVRRLLRRLLWVSRRKLPRELPEQVGTPSRVLRRLANRFGTITFSVQQLVRQVLDLVEGQRRDVDGLALDVPFLRKMGQQAAERSAAFGVLGAIREDEEDGR